MFLPDFNLVLEELLQLALTVASLKHLAGLVAEERLRQAVSDDPEEIVQQPHRPPGQSEIEESADGNPVEVEPKNESTAANEKAEQNSSTTSHDINKLEDVVESPIPPGNRNFEATTLTSHQLPESTENVAPFTSAVAHQLIPCQSEDYEVSMAVHQVDHEANELEEQVKEVDKDADTSMATHKLPEMEPESTFLSLPASLASHLVLPVEWPETGLLTSMVAHQVYQPCQENLEEFVPVGAHSQQETKEATFEDDLRENLKELLMEIDFKATYGNFEEDFAETKLAEDSTENIAMDYEVELVEEELVEEVGKEADNKNITHKVPEVEEVEESDADTTSMATHKLPEMEPQSTFLSLPATLTSHLVLPVEWPETGLTTSMVSHQIYQPCTEYFEETISAGACSPQLDQQYAKEDTLEENLRENLKDCLTGIDFKATYDNYEEDSLEATLAEDLPGNFAMANEAPIAVHQMEHEVVEENVEEVDKKADTGDIDHKLPEEEEGAVDVLDTAAEISMAAHKLSDIELKSVFQSLPGSLASHLVLPVEWPETGLSTSMVAHQIYQPSHKKLEETISQMPSLEHEASMDQHGVEEKCAVDLEENLRIYFKERSKDVDFKATYCHIEAEAEDPILNQRDSLDIRQSEDTPELHSIEEDHLEETSLIESGLSGSMVAQSLNLLVKEATKPEEEADTCTSMVSTTTMVVHQVVEAEELCHPYTSMAAHCSLVPEWKEEGIVSSGVSHQLLNHSTREEEDIINQNVPEKCEENLPEIEESVTTEKHSKMDVREDEVRQILKAQKDPRRSNEELALTSVVPKSPVVGPSDDEKDSFENFINESKQTYHERVADEYKSTIKRIQDLHKLVEEEIGEFEKSRKDVIIKSEVVTVMSNVKGVSFPLEITINQKDENDESLLEQEETQKEEGVGETIMESESEEEDCANIISASCTLRENTPILITTNMDQQVECDSGFEGSPDLKKTENGVRCLQVSFEDREAESPVSFPRQTLTKRSSEEKKTRDKQLLESFLKNENHQQIKDKTTVTNNSGSSVSPEKKQMPKMPNIPPPIAQESGEVKKQKNRKPKVTTTAFKDSIMKKTYKIRFHVNLKEGEAQKPRSVLQTFLSFFKDHSMFGKK